MVRKVTRRRHAFEWTAEEWAILEPLTRAERLKLVMRALLARKTIVALAKEEAKVPASDNR